MTSYALLPTHFTNAKYHRRCGIHVQTLLLCHEPITLFVTIAAISIGIVLLANPSLHRKTLLYKQFFEHYARVRSNNYILLYRIAIISWIAMHTILVITIITTVLATQLIRPELLYPQLLVLIILVGLYTFSLLAIITMNFIGSNIIWMTPFIISFFGFITLTNLYLIVLTHRYVADRREALQKILKNAKTVKFKEAHLSIKLYDEY
ncbi:ABC transporter G family member [Dirofilaria immitis]